MNELPPLEALEEAADKPPRERRQPAGRRRALKGTLSQQIVDGFTGLYVLMGGMIMVFNRYDGEVILAKSRDMAVTLEQVARRNAVLYKTLARLSNVSDVSAVLMSYGTVSYAIAANHGLVPVAPVATFGMPLPPEREVRSESAQESVPLPGWEQFPNGEEAYFGPLDEQAPSSPDGAFGTAPLHVPNAEQFAKIREQAIAAALAEQKLAQSRGVDGYPTINPSGGAFNG